MTATVDETFDDLVVTQQLRRCPILNLDIGPIFLDLLGLEVRTSRITIDVTAVAGPGKLLGNLLCAIAGLLDPPLTGGLLEAIQGVLQQILDLINDILAGA